MNETVEKWICTFRPWSCSENACQWYVHKVGWYPWLSKAEPCSEPHDGKTSAIHIYCNIPSHVWLGEGEATRATGRKRRRASLRGMAQDRLILGHKGGCQQFLINCACQDSNSRPQAPIPCHVSCTSQLSQKSELIERDSTIHIYCNRFKHHNPVTLDLLAR